MVKITPIQLQILKDTFNFALWTPKAPIHTDISVEEIMKDYYTDFWNPVHIMIIENARDFEYEKDTLFVFKPCVSKKQKRTNKYNAEDDCKFELTNVYTNPMIIYDAVKKTRKIRLETNYNARINTFDQLIDAINQFQIDKAKRVKILRTKRIQHICKDKIDE